MGARLSPVRRLVATVAALAAVSLGLVACGGDDDRPNIVVTTKILGDVVTRLVGDAADVHALMKPNADPHSFGISAREAGDVEQADLVVANGLGLEEGLESVLTSARDQGVDVLNVGEEVSPLDYTTTTPGTKDPHFWTDPARMITATQIIEDRLTDDLDDEDAAKIRDAAADYRSQLTDLNREVSGMLGSVPEADRKLVTNHHVFGYLADRFHYEVIGAIIPGGTTLAAPSAADLRDLSQVIQDNPSAGDLRRLLPAPTSRRCSGERGRRGRRGRPPVLGIPH